MAKPPVSAGKPVFSSVLLLLVVGLWRGSQLQGTSVLWSRLMVVRRLWQSPVCTRSGCQWPRAFVFWTV